MLDTESDVALRSTTDRKYGTERTVSLCCTNTNSETSRTEEEGEFLGNSPVVHNGRVDIRDTRDIK